MPSIVLLGLLPLAAFVLFKLLSFINTMRRRAALARNWGCKPVPILPSPDPLGIINVSRLIKSASAGRLTHLFMARTEQMSKLEGRPVGTYQFHVFRNWLFVTSDPKNIQSVLATQFDDFELGPLRTGTFQPLLGYGIFSVDGKRWEHSRALLRPQFVRAQVSDLDLEERHLQNMLKALPISRDGWTETTDLLPLYFRLTIDSATEFLFGESVNSQLAALPNASGDITNAEDAAFVVAIEKSQECIAYSFRFNDWYKLGQGKELFDNCKVCHQYIDRFVQRALRNKGKKSVDSNGKEKYVFLEGLAAETNDPVEIRSQLLSILVAGRDTTASLLSFLWLSLAQHPAVFEQLRKAVINEFGTFNHPKDISFSSLKSCSYLQWCLNETLRLFPTVPGNSRRSKVDTTIPRGGGPDGLSPVFIPKGTEVNYNVYVMHRSKELWGPDANEFVPERWQGRKAGFEYLPFNGGPRICLGQQFALTEAGYVTVRLLQRFDKIDGSAMAGVPDDWYLTLTGRPMHGVKLRLHVAAED